MEKYQKNTNIELRSEEVQELMGKIPPIILRVGISVILIFIVLIFILSHYIKYPDIITVEATLRNTNYAIDIRNTQEGFVQSEIQECVRHVAKGDRLAVITQNYGEEICEEVITSPVAGVVYPCDYFCENEYVSATTKLYTVANIIYSKVTAKTFVARDIKDRIHVGMKANAVVNGTKMSGKITHITRFANIQNETYAVLIELDNLSEPVNEIIWDYHTTVNITLGECSVFDKFFADKLKNNI